MALLSTQDLHAQTTIIDSLKSLLQKQTTDSARVDILVQLGKNYDNVDTSKARGYLRQVEEIAKKSGSEEFAAMGDELAGVLYTRYDQKKAMDYYVSAINIFLKQPQTRRIKRHVASLRNNLGVIHYLNSDLAGALDYFMSVVKFYEENDSLNFNLGYGYGNICTVYSELMKFENALVYSKKGLLFANKVNNQSLIMVANLAYANMLIKMQKYGEFMPYLERSKAIADELKNTYYIFLFYSNLGEYYYNIKDYRNSLASYQKAMAEAQLMASQGLIGTTLFTIGTCYVYLADFPSARRYLNNALKNAKDNSNISLEQTVYDAMSEMEEREGHYKEALSYRNKFIAIKDSLYSESNIKRIEFLDAQYQSEKKEKEILQLQKDKLAQAFSLRQKSTLNYVLVGSVVVLLLLSFLAYRNLRNRRQLAMQREEIHRQRIIELEKDRQLVAVDSLLKGQEDERSRLAKDLHDGLGGLLSGVKFSLSNMKDNLIVTPDNMTVFERSLDMIDTAIKELRRVAHNMMPEMLTKFGLDEAVKEYCLSMNATNLVKVKYQSFGMTERIEASSEIIIYRIIQELLNNVLKHSAATDVLVQVIREQNRLSVLVEDNGKGFDADLLKESKGSGWMSIRSRVDYLKGQIDIQSLAGKGTSVTIEFTV